MPEEHPEYAERDPLTVRKQYLSGSEVWQEALDILAGTPNLRVSYTQLTQDTGKRFGSTLGLWKRSQENGSESTRPFHIAFIQGYRLAWMDEVQAAAVKGDTMCECRSPLRHHGTAGQCPHRATTFWAPRGPA